MLYIKLEKEANGARESQITDANLILDGFTKIPKHLEQAAVSILPWIELTIENDEVATMTENTEAKLAWEAENPEKPTEPTVEEDMMNMLVEQEYQITLLQLGL